MEQGECFTFTCFCRISVEEEGGVSSLPVACEGAGLVTQIRAVLSLTARIGEELTHAARAVLF